MVAVACDRHEALRLTVPRSVADLHADALGDLPVPCRSCVFWEVAGAPRGGSPDPAAGAVAKEAWWQATELEWGTPGKALYLEGRLVACATFAPPVHFPRARRMGAAVSDDALLLATLRVDPRYAGAGLATVLLQAVLAETHRRGARALEAYGERRTGPEGAAWPGCVLPEAFLLAAGFTVRHDDRSFPLLRLDLRQTVRWQESVGLALEGVRSVLRRRERVPVPAHPAERRQGSLTNDPRSSALSPDGRR